MKFLSGSSYHLRDKKPTIKPKPVVPCFSDSQPVADVPIPDVASACSMISAILGRLAETGGSVELDIPKGLSSVASHAKVQIPTLIKQQSVT